MAKLTKEQIMVGADMASRGTSIRQIAKQMGVTEGALRYRLKQGAEDPKPDGRSFQPTALDGLEDDKHVRDWPEIFAGDEILTTAILDRLLHHVHIVHIDGRSYRFRELDGLLKPDQPQAKKGGSHPE
jgi:hypothetical protein